MCYYQQLISDEICSVQGQKDYCLGALKAGNLERWESKEYSALIVLYDTQLTELNARLLLAS